MTDLRRASIRDVRAWIDGDRAKAARLLAETIEAARAENDGSHAFIALTPERAAADLDAADPDAPLLGAVPYTHLRAHENVLELVCRLILANQNIHLYPLVLHSIHVTPIYLLNSRLM